MTTDIEVLIVDDDSIFRMDLRELLHTMSYLVVGEARDAACAITLARKLQPDLVIMDVRLPGAMDGIAAAGVLPAWPGR